MTLPKLTRTMFHRLLNDPEYLAAMQQLYGAIAQVKYLETRDRLDRRPHGKLTVYEAMNARRD
jgi:hypothetical protein